jgi:predicted acyltransferase
MKPQRLQSLDLFRGFVMFLLIAGGTGLFPALSDLTTEGTFWAWLAGQLHHHPWNGLLFWDLIQPFFM